MYGDAAHAPRERVDIRNAITTATASCQPIPAVETDVQHAVQPLRLVQIAFRRGGGTNASVYGRKVWDAAMHGRTLLGIRDVLGRELDEVIGWGR